MVLGDLHHEFYFDILIFLRIHPNDSQNPFIDTGNAPKSAKFENNSRNDPPLGTGAPPKGTIFLSEIFVLVSSISHLSMDKKLKCLFNGKAFNFLKY